MKTLRSLFVTAVSALAVVGIASAELEGWSSDLDKAMEQAKKENKSVLIEFTGSDWCPPCMMMRKTVFSKKEFVDGASKDYILVELDFPKADYMISLGGDGSLLESVTFIGNKQTPVLGITGTGGAGKSSLVDELVRRFLIDFPEKTIGIISVDPSKRKTGGA